MAAELCHPHTWPAQLVVLQKLQGVRLHCIWSGGTSPGHEAMSLAIPVSSTQVVVRFLTPPPHVLLHAPYSPTCNRWLRPNHDGTRLMSCTCQSWLIRPCKLHAGKLEDFKSGHARSKSASVPTSCEEHYSWAKAQRHAQPPDIMLDHAHPAIPATYGQDMGLCHTAC